MLALLIPYHTIVPKHMPRSTSCLTALFLVVEAHRAWAQGAAAAAAAAAVVLLLTGARDPVQTTEEVPSGSFGSGGGSSESQLLPRIKDSTPT